jgi:hypothetical protein
MKYVVISRLAPGVDNARKGLQVFMKAGVPEGTEALYAATDGKTFISIVEGVEPVDMTVAATYAPFWEESKVIPVVAADETWLQAIQAAQANWD